MVTYYVMCKSLTHVFLCDAWHVRPYTYPLTPSPHPSISNHLFAFLPTAKKQWMEKIVLVCYVSLQPESFMAKFLNFPRAQLEYVLIADSKLGLIWISLALYLNQSYEAIFDVKFIFWRTRKHLILMGFSSKTKLLNAPLYYYFIKISCR